MNALQTKPRRQVEPNEKAPAKRKRKSKKAWLDEEVKTLRDNWHNGLPITQWMHLIPKRSCRAIVQRALELELGPRGKCVNAEPPTWTAIKTALSDGKARTVKALAADAGVSARHVQTLLNRFHGTFVRVAKWGKASARGGDRPPLWGWGGEPDCPKPTPLTKRQVAERHRKKRAKDPARLALHNEKQAFRRAIRRGIGRADLAAAWITTPIKPEYEPIRIKTADAQCQEGGQCSDAGVQSPWGRQFRLDGPRARARGMHPADHNAKVPRAGRAFEHSAR